MMSPYLEKVNANDGYVNLKIKALLIISYIQLYFHWFTTRWILWFAQNAQTFCSHTKSGFTP